MRSIRETLFPREQWSGCSNHDCIVTGAKKGMGTNGSCHCLMNASRTQLNILKARIQLLMSEQEKQDSPPQASNTQ